jgi:hypothetical protein
MYYLVLYKMPVALRYPARISTQVQVIYSRFTSESYSRGGLAWSQLRTSNDHCFIVGVP